MADPESMILQSFIAVLAIAISLWGYYMKVYNDAFEQINKASRLLKKNRKKIRRSFLTMMSNTTDMDSIGKILDTCFLPLRDIETDMNELLYPHNKWRNILIKAILLLGVLVLLIFDVLIVSLYIAYKWSFDILVTMMLFIGLSVIGLGIVMVIQIYNEQEVKAYANKIKELLGLLEKSAEKGECLEELEELLKESK